MGWWHAKFSIDVNTFTVLLSCPKQGSVGCTGRKSPHRLAAFCPFRPLRRELAVWCNAILVRLRLQDGFKEYVIHGDITVMRNFLPLSETKISKVTKLTLWRQQKQKALNAGVFTLSNFSNRNLLWGIGRQAHWHSGFLTESLHFSFGTNWNNVFWGLTAIIFSVTVKWRCWITSGSKKHKAEIPTDCGR